MLRVLLKGLLLSNIRRTSVSATATQHHLAIPHSRSLASTCRNLNVMEQQGAFEKMEDEGVPQCTGPKEQAMKKEEEAKALPKLSAAEFKVYNHMAEHMNYFHENFRRTWQVLYAACTSGKRPSGMSIRQFLAMGDQFAHHLTVHHTIEEQHIFPVLAKKMPLFKKELHLLTQHKAIHAGLDKFEEYIQQCRSGERELRLEELKVVMDGFGTVLWQHLDDEVRQLGAEEMRKHWTVEEMRRMPM